MAGDRNKVCDDFEAYLSGQHALLARLPELKGKVLACSCHGHHLAKLANNTP